MTERDERRRPALTYFTANRLVDLPDPRDQHVFSPTDPIEKRREPQRFDVPSTKIVHVHPSGRHDQGKVRNNVLIVCGKVVPSRAVKFAEARLEQSFIDRSTGCETRNIQRRLETCAIKWSTVPSSSSDQCLVDVDNGNGLPIAAVAGDAHLISELLDRFPAVGEPH